MKNINFKIWMNESNYNNLEAEIDNEIEKIKTFKSTIKKPFPTAYEYKKTKFDLDILAVIAGVKPAALIPDLNLNHLYNKIIIKKAKSQNLKISTEGGLFNDQLIIGKSENVNNILMAYKILQKYPLGTINENVINAHRIIGVNLGYPKEVIDDFINKIINNY